MTATQDRPAASPARSARIGDYYLGGGDWNPRDRELADTIEALFPRPKPGRLPVPREVVLEAGAFTGRAVRWAAARGIRQFADASPVLPAARTVMLPSGRRAEVPAVHEAAGPGARVLYVREDPLTCSHAGAAVRGQPGVGVVCAGPGSAAAQDAAAAVLDLDEPVAVVLVRTLDFMPAGAARAVCAGWLRVLAPGSVLIVGCARVDPPASDPGLWEKITAAYTIGPVFNHGPGEILSFLRGTRLEPPGLVVAQAWQPGQPARMQPDVCGYVLGGVGIAG